MIINTNLCASQIHSLLRVVRLHRKATEYTVKDLKGIHRSVHMYCILKEDDHKPLTKHQRSLYPNKNKMVKN